MATDDSSVLNAFHPAVKAWFSQSFPSPTLAQTLGWPALVKNESTLILAPTGSGKTLTAFLHCIDRLMFSPKPEGKARCRVLYLSPIKALAVDVERNLREPIEGIARVAEARGEPFRRPDVMMRTGDTPQKERNRFTRESADLLITTPESLYLLLTSNAREALRGVETVILDEIHALVPTKRGAHLALSLERLEWMIGKPLQRIGLSATQRPLDEVARFLAGSRPVTIIDASTPKTLELTVEVPVEDMTKMGEAGAKTEPGAPPSTSLWAAIHPRLLELVRSHRSTLLFVNNRRTAERLAASLNELAGEVLVHAHHGSLAKDQRALIEERLKAGHLKGLVATSSLELGIDMGAIDLVVQIEAPPSVASGLQRIGRAGHQVGASSEGIVFPKFRGDLVACAALSLAMQEGAVERTKYPRNPLDVLAQHLVAMVAVDDWKVEPLFELVRSAAPFAELSRPMLEGVLDLLSGRYPSDEFAELRPRLTWDRLTNTLKARDGAKRIAIVNGGTIPDRGLYGVFLAGAPKGQARVGELDEEMVFETKPGETFVLGASTWRVQEITFDKVIVSAAPGEPGKMPFWRGDQTARPLEFGRRIGALVRELRALPRSTGHHLLTTRHHLTELAANNLLAYLDDQDRKGAVPDDQTVVIERGRDELGDWRVCVLSPLGGQILAPWSMAVQAHVRETLGLDVETMWANDGFVVRWPEGATPPEVQHLLPRAEDVERLVVSQLSQTPLFAARFREIASRALLLPRKRPGQRTPLWQLRKKSQDLLAAASPYPSFPMILETYRECLRDVFDMPALLETLKDVERGAVTVKTTDPKGPSPFASSLLFGYVANFLYEGDAPLAERRAQALTIDTLQLKELMGEAELRELLDRDALAELEAFLQHTDERSHARTVDGVHDLLLRLGDLSQPELERRCDAGIAATIDELLAARRAVRLTLAGEPRFIPVEYAARYRDALGLTLPAGLPAALLGASEHALSELLLRYARTHGPFTTEDVCRRFGLDVEQTGASLRALVLGGKLLDGAFRPGGTQREWCDPEVLRNVRRKSLARLRKEIEPVSPDVLTRMLTAWQGVTNKRRGPDAVLDCIEKLQGLPLPASMLEREVLAARLEQYLPSDLDTLAAAGEVVWVGVETLGESDGRVALYLTDDLPKLYRPPAIDVATLPEKERLLFEHLRAHGASFFPALQQAAGGGFPQETLDALWALVWRGLVTNDGFFALRAATQPIDPRVRRAWPDARSSFRSRRHTTPPTAEGRWSLVTSRFVAPGVTSTTEWAHATAQQLLSRYGVVTREVALAEDVPGGFTTLHDVFRSLEESGRVRRGYFVTGVSAMQFALPPVLDLLRMARSQPPRGALEVLALAAVDPANPFGALLPWPALDDPRSEKRLTPMRMRGARVMLVEGHLVAWLSRGARSALVWLPSEEPRRGQTADAIATRLAGLARGALDRREGMLLEEVNGVPAHDSVLADALARAGFARTSVGFQMRRSRAGLAKSEPTEE